MPLWQWHQTWGAHERACTDGRKSARASCKVVGIAMPTGSSPQDASLPTRPVDHSPRALRETWMTPPSSGISAIAYNRLKGHLGLEDGTTRVYDVVQQLAEPEETAIRGSWRPERAVGCFSTRGICSMRRDGRHLPGPKRRPSGNPTWARPGSSFVWHRSHRERGRFRCCAVGGLTYLRGHAEAGRPL